MESLYQNPKANLKEIVVLEPHNPEQWVKAFKEAIKGGRSPIGAMQRIIYFQTRNIVKRGFYLLPDGTKVELNTKEMASRLSNTVQYQNELIRLREPSTLQLKSAGASIKVIERDCLEVALDLKLQQKANPVVLILANKKTAGGGVLGGSSAQEENMFRRTNLHQHLADPKEYASLRNWAYPIPETGGMYASNVSVIRGSQDDGYPFLDKPELMSFIAVPAISKPKCNTPTEMGEYAAGLTKQRMKCIFNIAVDQGHDAVILGAMGCGAYRNPPAHIAKLFKEVIEEGDFNKKLKYIYFAIIEDHRKGGKHNPEGNVKPFKDVFDSK